jgi:sulfite reductase beta subunit-like hemoprotein
MVNQMPSDVETQKNKERCQELLKLSPKIRYVGIINEFGRTLAGQLRKGVAPLFKVEEARNEFFIEATRNRLRRSFVDSIGKAEFTITVNQKVIILMVPTSTGSQLY